MIECSGFCVQESVLGGEELKWSEEKVEVGETPPMRSCPNFLSSFNVDFNFDFIPRLHNEHIQLHHRNCTILQPEIGARRTTLISGSSHIPATMDFAALMSKEISKAKGDSKSSGAGKDKGNTPEPPKKYMRRGEVEAARVAAYNEEQERAERERQERQANKRKLEEDEADRKREREEKKRKFAEESRKRREEEEEAAERERRRKLGLPDLPSKSDAEQTPDNTEAEDIEEDELIAKLREIDEPARLFGENHQARLRRYRRLVQRAATKQKITDGPIPTILQPVPGSKMISPAKIPKEQDERLFLLRQLGSYFNMVLSEWELALAKRDISVRQSFQGKQAYNAMLQSRENMKPLFRRLEKSDLEDGLLEPIVEIVHKAQQRKYVDANDAYLRVSIGKAYVLTLPPPSISKERKVVLT
jgi:pre-mRNA-splicing factor 18